MLRGLWKLTWLETKIFVREPLGVVGTVGVPIVLFLLLGRIGGRGAPRLLTDDLPILVAVMIAMSAIISLVSIIAIYREGGILKRLRATPLQPTTILLAHVLVKLGFTALSLVVLVLLGMRSVSPGQAAAPFAFGLALLFVTFTLLSIGFVLASIVPTARFAQPLATSVIYTMLAFSGLFVAIERMPGPVRVVARALPLPYAVSLLRGTWRGEGWIAHSGDVAALLLVCATCTLLSARLFRWE
ncbi:MAG: ABC transporter permease [Acidobacteria bacterium]|nr:ABC transporter permease [Acidobacteriota bacterium]